MTQVVMSRKNFLELAAGSAVGAALFRFPTAGMAAEVEKASRSLKAVKLADMPMNAVEAGKMSALVKQSYQSILKTVKTIKNENLRRETLALIEDPTLKFLGDEGAPWAQA